MNAPNALTRPSVPDHIRPESVVDFDLYRDYRFEEEGGLHEGLWRLIQETGQGIFWTPHNGGHWFITDHELLFEAAKRPDLFSSTATTLPPMPPEEEPRLIPLGLDPPIHGHYRLPLMRAFSPDMIKAIEGGIREFAAVEELAANDRAAGTSAAMREWRKGWPIVLAGMFGNGLLAMGFMAMGTFMAPLETAFGWTRTDVTLGYLVFPFSAVLAPFVVTRGLSLSVAMTGIAVAASFVPYLTNALTEQAGWRGAFVTMGLGGGGIVALVCFFGIPARPAGRDRSTGGRASETKGMTIAQALRTASYIKLLIACFIINLLLQALMTHLVPVPSSDGLARGDAVKVAGSIGIGLIAGKLVMGAMLDRWNAKLVTTICLVLLTASFALLGIAHAPGWERLVAVLLLGLASGGLAPIFPYLVARIFGTASFGPLFGAMTTVYAVANALGPVGAAKVYDQAHSYSTMLITAPLALLVAVAMIWSLGRLPEVERKAD